MATYADGYVQALLDAKVAVQQMVSDLGTTPERKIELLAVLSILTHLIDIKMGRYDDHETDQAANENAAEVCG